jgi:hypothetical protein
VLHVAEIHPTLILEQSKEAYSDQFKEEHPKVKVSYATFKKLLSILNIYTKFTSRMIDNIL